MGLFKFWICAGEFICQCCLIRYPYPRLPTFENPIRIWDYPQILTRTVKVRPPFHGGNVAPENYIEGLLWSELGDYVREILRKEKE